MKNNDISAKVAGASTGAALSTIVLFCLHQWGHVEAPAEVGAALATVLAAVGGWLARDTARDTGTGNNAPAAPAPVEEPNTEPAADAKPAA